ncbi:hypothetical protein ACWEIJ_42170 [Lentzea sp. NPDC004789]
MTTTERKATQWRWLALALALGGVSVWLASAARDTVTSFHQRTAHLCDGTIPLPATAFVLTWFGVLTAVGALAAALILLMRRRHLTGLILGCVLTVVGGLVLLSAGWTTLDIYADAAPVSRVCGG